MTPAWQQDISNFMTFIITCSSVKLFLLLLILCGRKAGRTYIILSEALSHIIKITFSIFYSQTYCFF